MCPHFPDMNYNNFSSPPSLYIISSLLIIYGVLHKSDEQNNEMKSHFLFAKDRMEFYYTENLSSKLISSKLGERVQRRTQEKGKISSYKTSGGCIAPTKVTSNGGKYFSQIRIE